MQYWRDANVITIEGKFSRSDTEQIHTYLQELGKRYPEAKIEEVTGRARKTYTATFDTTKVAKAAEKWIDKN